MNEPFDMIATHARVRERIDLFNNANLDAVVEGYADNVVFSFPTQIEAGYESHATGVTKDDFSTSLKVFQQNFSPIEIEQVSGSLRGRTVIVKDVRGDRIMMTIETEHGLITKFLL